MEKQISFCVTSREMKLIKAIVAQKSCDFISCKMCPVAEAFGCGPEEEIKAEALMAKFIMDNVEMVYE